MAGVSSYVEGVGHAGFVDMDLGPDVLDPGADLAGFVAYTRGVMQDFRVPVAWLIETGGGYHLVAPFQFSMKEALAFHRCFNKYGADDMHRLIASQNDRFILRVTRKGREKDHPRILTRIRAAVGDPRPVIGPVKDFFVARNPQAPGTDFKGRETLYGNGQVILEGWDAE